MDDVFSYILSWAADLLIISQVHYERINVHEIHRYLLIMRKTHGESK